jgi:hypothetical protein
MPLTKILVPLYDNDGNAFLRATLERVRDAHAGVVGGHQPVGGDGGGGAAGHPQRRQPGAGEPRGVGLCAGAARNGRCRHSQPR